MILYWWGIDWFIFIIFNFLFMFFITFIYERELILKFAFNETKRKYYFKNYLKDILIINSSWHKICGKIYIYILVNLFISLTYLYGWDNYFINMQIYTSNIGWFYLFYLLVLVYFLLITFNYSFRNNINSFDVRNASVILILLFIFYIFLNNYFIILFLIECQGVVVLYLLSVNNSITSTAGDLLKKNDGYSHFYKEQLWQLASLFTHFWSAFIAAVLLVFVGIRLAYTLGAINWVDITLLSYFWLFSVDTQVSFVTTIGSLIFVALALKVGIFPFHFWKPDLYKKISLWTMLWYMMLYTFVIIFFLIIFFNYFLINYLVNWRTLIYTLQILGLLILANVLYAIVELRPFLAYMSVFHIFFIFSLFLIFNSAGISFFYLITYAFLSIHIFVFLFLLKNKEIKFLADLQVLEQNILIAAVAIITIVAMSGLPPFIGFWIKLSVITSLISNQEYLLALLALAVGLFLMFFYLQNYRFSGNLKFNLLQSSYIIEKKFISLNIIVSSLLIVNFIYIFFVNDLLNWNILLNLLY